MTTMTAAQVRTHTGGMEQVPDLEVPVRPRPPRSYPAAYKLRILEVRAVCIRPARVRCCVARAAHLADQRVAQAARQGGPGGCSSAAAAHRQIRMSGSWPGCSGRTRLREQLAKQAGCWRSRGTLRAACPRPAAPRPTPASRPRPARRAAERRRGRHHPACPDGGHGGRLPRGRLARSSWYRLTAARRRRHVHLGRHGGRSHVRCRLWSASRSWTPSTPSASGTPHPPASTPPCWTRAAICARPRRCTGRCERSETGDRRRHAIHPARVKPELLATKPNQCWSDITRLAGPAKWTWFYLYTILDIFSRYVVGWMVAHREAAALAERLLADTLAAQDVELRPAHHPR